MNDVLLVLEFSKVSKAFLTSAICDIGVLTGKNLRNVHKSGVETKQNNDLLLVLGRSTRVFSRWGFHKQEEPQTAIIRCCGVEIFNQKDILFNCVL